MPLWSPLSSPLITGSAAVGPRGSLPPRHQVQIWCYLLTKLDISVWLWRRLKPQISWLTCWKYSHKMLLWCLRDLFSRTEENRCNPYYLLGKSEKNQRTECLEGTLLFPTQINFGWAIMQYCQSNPPRDGGSVPSALSTAESGMLKVSWRKKWRSCPPTFKMFAGSNFLLLDWA